MQEQVAKEKPDNSSFLLIAAVGILLVVTTVVVIGAIVATVTLGWFLPSEQANRIPELFPENHVTEIHYVDNQKKEKFVQYTVAFAPGERPAASVICIADLWHQVSCEETATLTILRMLP